MLKWHHSAASSDTWNLTHGHITHGHLTHGHLTHGDEIVTHSSSSTSTSLYTILAKQMGFKYQH